jgi:hypothetical protein
MELRTHATGERHIVEVVSGGVLIQDTRDALELIGNAPSDYIILHEHNFASDFFDLSTRKLGDVLLKFGNYHIRLAVLGEFERYPSKALRAFIYETNQHGEFLFVASIEDVLRLWGPDSED